MPYSYSEIKTFRGLYLQKNSFTVPDGAMEMARNCILFQDNRISKTRGYYDYFLPEGGGILNNLFYYQNHLMAIYEDKLAYLEDEGTYPNFTGLETDLSGATVLITSPRTSRSVQSSSNLYMTSDLGVLKIDAYNAKIYNAGVPPGLDLSGILNAENGWFGGQGGMGSQVAYRIVFGRRDANANLLLGSPSEQLVLTNNQVATVSYTVGGVVSPWLITVTSPGHNLTTGMTITVATSTGTPVVPPSDYTVTVIDADTFSFDVLGATSPGAGNLSYDTSRTVQIEGTVPSDINDVTDGYFVQIYRTTATVAATITPTPNYRLVEERQLTASEIAAHRIFYNDDVDDVLVSSAPELYTNPNSREGELQSNVQPPKCDDMTFFKDCTFYANCTTRHVLAPFDLVDADALTDGDYIETKIDATIRRYIARSGVGNTLVETTSLSYATPLLTITYPNHGLLNGDTVLISNAMGTGTLPDGSYAVSNVTTNTFDISQVGLGTVTYLEFEGVSNAAAQNIFTLDNTSPSISLQLRTTARGLIKAINRDGSSLIYAVYASSINDVPGKMALQAKGFGDPIYLRANSTTAGSAFQPTLPDSFSVGTQVFSDNESKPNSFYSSKVGEPEAVPIVNEFKAGSRNAKIFRIVALRDSVVILKGDGVYRMTGDSPLNFNVTAIDNTIFCVSANSVSLLNNQIYFLSNQGVCVVTESSAQILSREKVEDVIIPIVGKPNLEVNTGAVGYESDRTYRLSTVGPNDDVRTVSYIYNFINDSWTTFDELFKQGVSGPTDTLFLISQSNKIRRERKTQTRIDYCGQQHPITVVSVTAGKMAARISSPEIAPEEGDVLLKDDTFSRIRTVTSAGGSLYDLSFRTASNIADADEIDLYEGYETEIDFAPFHAGQVGLMKQYAQMQIHTRTPSITRLEITFSGYTYGGSELTVWEVGNVMDAGALGWGLFPWGFEPWGQADAINISIETKPAPPLRIYIPRFQQRNTYLKTRLVHREAGESLDIQAIAYAVRPYKERVSK